MFKKILDIIDSNKFNHKNKIGEFNYNEIKNLVNNIENNTISEIDAKKDLKRLFKIKNAELKKYKIRTSKQNELLNLFDDLLTIILINNDNDNDNENKNDNDNDNDNENENVNEIKQLNDSLDKMIDESKSFEEQIELLKKVKNLNE